MIQMTNNTLELKQIYTYDKEPITSNQYAHNLGYKLGASTWNANYFEPYLNKLVKNGVITKEYDFVNDGFREAVYTFADGSLIEFFGTNHMSLKLSYCY
jgi:hypothetical protein